MVMPFKHVSLNSCV